MAEETDRDTEARRGRSIDPLAAGMRDGVNAGYHAVEYVLEGLRESIGVRAGRTGARPVRPPSDYPYAPPERRPPLRGGSDGGRPAAVSAEVIGDLTHILGELLERAGEVAHDVARAFGEHGDREATGPAARGTPAVLELEAAAGEEARTTFTFWNTTPSVLRDVEVVATDLFGAAGLITGEHVTFEPERLEGIRPGAAAEFTLTIRTTDAAPGTYRSLAQANPGDACVVLQLTVT